MEKEIMVDELTVFGRLDYATIVRHDILLSKSGTSKVCMTLLKERGCIGFYLHSDGWPAYNGIAQYGYTHNTVNHSEHFVDPLTQAHTQRIESLWRPLRLKVVKNMCGRYKILISFQGKIIISYV